MVVLATPDTVGQLASELRQTRLHLQDVHSEVATRSRALKWEGGGVEQFHTQLGHAKQGFTHCVDDLDEVVGLLGQAVMELAQARNALVGAEDFVMAAVVGHSGNPGAYLHSLGWRQYPVLPPLQHRVGGPGHSSRVPTMSGASSPLFGVDSSQPPTLAQAWAAARAGVKWWGGYVGGSWHRDAWPASAWTAVKSAGITPIPIWVPKMWLDDPVVAARDAMAEVKRAGLRTTGLVLDTEAEEEQLMPASRVKAWVDAWNRTLARAGWTSVVYDGADHYHGRATEWRPDWNFKATAWPGAAHQYQGNTSRWGVAIDLDVASPGFALLAARRPPKTATTKVVVSPPQLLQMAEDLVDARLDVAGLHQRTEAVAAELAGVASNRLVGAADVVQRALQLLSEIDGPGTGGFAHTRGAIYQAEMIARHTREQALRADAGHQPRANQDPNANREPSGNTGTVSGTTVIA